jgi:hypothetical protein
MHVRCGDGGIHNEGGRAYAGHSGNPIEKLISVISLPRVGMTFIG